MSTTPEKKAASFSVPTMVVTPEKVNLESPSALSVSTTESGGSIVSGNWSFDETGLPKTSKVAKRWSLEKIRLSFASPEEALQELNLNLEFVGLKYLWAFCLAMVGLLDILGSVLPDYINYDDPPTTQNMKDDQDSVVESSTFKHLFRAFVRWLDHYNVMISFLFAALWFIDAWYDAKKKKYLLEERRDLRVSKEDKQPTKERWWQNATFTYRATILTQLLLLPVGIYLTLYSYMRGINGENLGDLGRMDEEIFLCTESDTECTKLITSKSKRTLLFAIMAYLWTTFSNETTHQAVLFLRKAGPRALRTVLGSAIRHPMKFRKGIRKLLTLVRWLKYLGPIFGTFNKLKGNVEDMIKKHRQQNEAKKYQKIRQALFKKKTGEVKRGDAARMIQSAYRSYRTRQAVHAVKILRGEKEYLAAKKMQRALRRKLAEARARIEKKKAELKQLQRLRLDNESKLTRDEKRRMYELQDELGTEASKILNHKLLLRPNTRFSVAWKVLFVICVTIEITQLVLRPVLDYSKEKKSKEVKRPLGMDEFIAMTFVPSRISDWPECQMKKKSQLPGMSFSDNFTAPWYCHDPVLSIQEGMRDFVALASIPSPVSEWKECQKKKQSRVDRIFRRAQKELHPWYCDDPYSTVHNYYRALFDFLLDEFLTIVGIIMFLDVPITFFTGELDSNTGSLIPKPFFERWILPGLLLQFAVNPQMDTVSKVSIKAIQQAVQYGPIRIIRWCIATLFPIVYCATFVVREWIWLPIVARQNMRTIKRPAGF